MFAKICAIDSQAKLSAAIGFGADMVGFVMAPGRPASLDPDAAGALVGAVPSGVDRVGVFADQDQAAIAAVLRTAPLDLIQLDGAETPQDARELRDIFRLPVIRTVRAARRADLDQAAIWWAHLDWLRIEFAGDLAPEQAADWRPPRPWLAAGGPAVARRARAPGFEYVAPAEDGVGAIRRALEAGREGAGT